MTNTEIGGSVRNKFISNRIP